MEPALLKALHEAHASGVKRRPNSRVAWNMLRIDAATADPSAVRACVLGAPGAGKSSLILALTDDRCEPRPVVGAHTDATDWSREHRTPRWHQADGLAFIDGPGHGTRAHPVAAYDWLPIWKFHCVLFVIAGKIMQSDEQLWARLLERRRGPGQPKLRVIRNMADQLTTNSDRRRVTRDAMRHLPRGDAAPLLTSATDAVGIDDCLDWLRNA